MRWLALFALTAMPMVSQADMNSVRVRLQSGQDVSIADIPMVRIIRLYPFGQQVFSNPTLVFYEHVLFGVPNYCPHGWYWAWAQGFSDEMISQRKETCSRDQRKKLTFLPEQDRGICDCKLILKTAKIKAIGQLPLMQSMDDEILLSDQFKVARRLRHGDEFLPVLVSLSGSGHGEFYDYSGNVLCRGQGRPGTSFKNSLDQTLLSIRSGKAASVRIECLGGRTGWVDFSEMSYSVLQQRLEGVIRLKLDNGETYEVVQ